MLTKEQKRKLNALAPELGVNVQVTQRYNRLDKYPEDLALAVDAISDGELPAAVMCPNTLGVTRDRFRRVASGVVHLFKQEVIEDSVLVMLTLIVNLIEHEQPELYENLVDTLDSVNGKKFIQTRVLNRENNNT